MFQLTAALKVLKPELGVALGAERFLAEITTEESRPARRPPACYLTPISRSMRSDSRAKRGSARTRSSAGS